MNPLVLAEIEKLCKVAQQKKEDTPFLVFDVDNVVDKVKLWRDQMPRIEPYYAVKCNNDPMLLRTLASLDIGFDCASKGEMETIINMGVPANRVVYSNTFKAFSHLRYAANLKIELMTFDNEAELLKIKQLFPSAKLLLRLLVRESNAKVPMNVKFGCDETEVSSLLEAALQHNLPIVGVSFHVGSLNQDPNDYMIAIKMCRRVFDIAEKKGIVMHMVDIGGGFPGFATSRDPRKVHFAEIAGAVNKAIDEHFPSDGPFEIIAEPGRYFCTSAFTLCASIIAKKKRFVDNEEDTMYIINEGGYGLFLQSLFNYFQPLLKEISTRSKPKRSSIWGQTCDPRDVVMRKGMISDLKVGDWILFEDMGAYTNACSTTFNGFEKTRVKFVVYEKTLVEIEKVAGSNLNRLLKA